MLRIYLLLFVIGTIGGGGFLAYKQYKDMESKVIALSSQNQQLKDATAQQEEAMKTLQSDLQAANDEIRSVNEAFNRIRQQNNMLAGKLADIDLGVMAVRDADDIEFKVNRGTTNAGRCFELLSGAELNEQEKGAQNAKDFNRECPWLYDDYKSRGMLNEPTDTGDSNIDEAGE